MEEIHKENDACIVDKRDKEKTDEYIRQSEDALYIEAYNAEMDKENVAYVTIFMKKREDDDGYNITTSIVGRVDPCFTPALHHALNQIKSDLSTQRKAIEEAEFNEMMNNNS